MGVQIHEKAPVLSVKRLDGTRHKVVTPRGSVRADQVLVATSGYTNRPFRWLQLRIVPVGSFIIVTEPLGKEVCDQLLPNRRMASDSKNLLNYFRITPDHRLLFGGRARFAMSNPDSDEKSGRILQKAMRSVFPQLADARVDYCWGGQVDMTLDRLVHAGEHDGLYYSVGYSGHGVQMATYMGKQMAEYMNGVPEANPWRDITFKRIPGHVGPPWFLPVRGGLLQVPGRHQVNCRHVQPREKPMVSFLIRRAATLLVTLLVVSMLTFLIPYAGEGDPARKILRARVNDPALDPAQVEALTKELGLDRPLWQQYLDWLEPRRQGRLRLLVHQPHFGP